MTVQFSRTVLAAALASALGIGASAHAATTTIAASSPNLPAIDAARANPRELILPSGVFDPAAQRLDFATTGAAADVKSSNYAIVQLEPGQTKALAALRRLGIEPLGYVPNNAYYVRLGNASLAQVSKEAAVRWAGLVQPGMKLDPRLWTARRAASEARLPDGRYAVEIQLFGGESSARIVAALQKFVPGVEIHGRSERAQARPFVRAIVDGNGFDRLLVAATALEGVSFVSPWVQPMPNNSGAIGAIQGNSTAACAGSGTVCGPTPIWDHGIFGTGQIVAVSDTGTDANEAWFTTLDRGSGPHTEVTLADDPPPPLPAIGTLYPNNKIVGYWVQPGATAYDNNETCPFGNGSSSSWHGTHTSGTLVGDAAGTFGATTYTASTPTAANHDLADGMAPNAQLLQQDIGNDVNGCLEINDLSGTLEQAVAGGARIHSDSWGSAGPGVYGGDATEVDYATNQLEDLLVVFSAGNSGPGATTIGSPGTAKNALTVGALGHAGATNVAGFSSRGPTADGRVKPDIMAPGSSTISAAGDSSTNSTPEAPITKGLSGTSMAAPTVAGNAALMRQYFADGFYPRGTKTAADTYNASGTAMKAVLLNGTNPLQPTNWPNGDIGWGREWLDGNLWFASTQAGGDDSRRMRLFERTNLTGVKTGDVDEYTIANVGAGQELRVTLTWFDPEAAPGAAVTLVNNLDLEVAGPGGTTYYGNHLSGGESTPGGDPDAINTVEQVRLTAPAAGSYTLRVRGTSVPGNGRPQTDRQGYALAFSGAFGLPDQPAFAAPTGLTVAGNGTSGVQIGFSAAGGAQGFQLYRANGTCATAAAGDFRLVATGTASPLVDTRSEGGFSYAYKVRGVQKDVEGTVSACVDVVSQDDCTLLPEFASNSLSADGENTSCSVDLAWSSATAACPGSTGVTFNVIRDTDPYFSHPQTIATEVATPGYLDAGVANGTPYYYRAIAVDSLGNESNPTDIAFATPSGTDGPDPSAYLDNVDDHAYMIPSAPWRITNTAAADGVLSYHNASDDGNYPSLTCASITTPALTVMPGATTLSFMAQYDMEKDWDGVVLEISTDGGAIWNDLPPDGGYPGSFSATGSPAINACGYPASHGAFNGVTTATSDSDPGNGTATAVFKPFTVDLGAFVGQTVRVRWNMSSDPGSEFGGFWLDQVQLGTVDLDMLFRNGFETVGDYMCH